MPVPDFFDDGYNSPDPRAPIVRRSTKAGGYDYDGDRHREGDSYRRLSPREDHRRAVQKYAEASEYLRRESPQYGRRDDEQWREDGYRREDDQYRMNERREDQYRRDGDPYRREEDQYRRDAYHRRDEDPYRREEPFRRDDNQSLERDRERGRNESPAAGPYQYINPLSYIVPPLDFETIPAPVVAPSLSSQNCRLAGEPRQGSVLSVQIPGNSSAVSVQWMRHPNQAESRTQPAEIPGANGLTYTVTSSDVGFLIGAKISTKDTSLALWTSEVTADIPVASSVRLQQSELGGLIRVTYSYWGGVEGKSLIEWYFSRDGNVWNRIPSMEGLKEGYVGSDTLHNAVRVKVTPVRADGAKGEPILGHGLIIASPDFCRNAKAALIRGIHSFTGELKSQNPKNNTRAEIRLRYKGFVITANKKKFKHEWNAEVRFIGYSNLLRIMCNKKNVPHGFRKFLREDTSIVMECDAQSNVLNSYLMRVFHGMYFADIGGEFLPSPLYHEWCKGSVPDTLPNVIETKGNWVPRHEELIWRGPYDTPSRYNMQAVMARKGAAWLEARDALASAIFQPAPT